MSDVTITTGDDVDFLLQVTKDDVNLVIDVAATVTSRIVSRDGQIVYSDQITALSTDDGADWPNGLIALEYSSAVTTSIESSDISFERGKAVALVETRIVDNGKKSTVFDSITINKGNVT